MTAEMTDIEVKSAPDDSPAVEPGPERVPEPEPTVVHKEPEPTVVQKELEPTVVHTEPEPTVVNAQPEPSVVHKELEPTVVHKELEPTVVHKEPEPTVVQKEPEPIAVHKEPKPITVHKEQEEELDPEDDEGDEEDGEEKDEESGPAKSLDDDLDRRNPQYIPKGGAFYEHDNRTSDVPDAEAPAELDKKKKMIWKESKTSERWLHDCYVEDEQAPKTADELSDIYGYDIRDEENAPRARRRRKYGRGPDKYDRKWDDEQAYIPAPNRGRGRGAGGGVGGPRRSRGGEEFPPLPDHNGGPMDREREPPRNNRPMPQQNQNGPPRRGPPNSEPRSPPRGPQGQGPPMQRGTPQRSEPSSGPPRGPPPGRPRMEDHIKPFRTDGGGYRPSDNSHVSRSGRSMDGPKPSTPNNKDVHDLSRSISQMGIQQKPVPKDPRMKENLDGMKNSPSGPAELPANRQNPKRYSKIRKGFPEYFPPEDCPELDPREASRALQRNLPQQAQQEMLPPNCVMPNFPETYSISNAAFVAGRPMMPMQQQALRPQPQPPIQQALSPQMASIELPPQPNFVPPPLYIDMGQGEVVPFQGYPTYPPQVQNQNTELYMSQTPSGITYYSPEIQTGTGQPRALPQRRKVAIPIVPPPDTR